MKDFKPELPKLSKILVAVDGSHFAEKAGIAAADLARKYSADLTIFHVAKYPQIELGIDRHTVAVGSPLPDPDVDRLKQEAAESMHRVASFAKSVGVIAVHEMITDTSSSIVEVIIDFAYRNEIDLIVVGTRGLNEFSTSLLGSVSEGLVEQSRCNALVVK